MHLYGLIFLPITNLLVDVMSKPFGKTLSLLMALQYYLLLVCLLLLNSISAGFPSPKFFSSLAQKENTQDCYTDNTFVGGVRVTALFITSCIMNCGIEVSQWRKWAMKVASHPPTSACLLTPGELVA